MPSDKKRQAKLPKWFPLFLAVFLIIAAAVSLITDGPLLEGRLAAPFVVFALGMWLFGMYLMVTGRWRDYWPPKQESEDRDEPS